MRLYLAEKHDQGDKIARFLDPNVDISDRKATSHYLSSGDVVSWCRGHLYEPAPPEYYNEELKKWALKDLPFRPQRWALLPKNDDSERNRQTVNSLLNEADEVVICTDYDREGQVLGMTALFEAGFNDFSRIYRAKITELNDAELKKAFAAIEPISLSMPMYYSGVARRNSDWLVGMNYSRFFSCLAQELGIRETINIGRVMTPMIAMVVNRDLQILNFKSRDYYEIFAQLNVQKGTFKVKWQPQQELLDQDGYMTDIQTAQAVEAKCRGKMFEVKDVERKVAQEHPPLLFSLGDLSVYCANHFGISPSQTLEIVQFLYDNRYTTYPRTDCRYLPESRHAEAPQTLEALKRDPNLAPLIAGCDLNLKSRVFNDKKFEGHPHGGIIPTAGEVDLSALNELQFKVYDIIRRYYIAQFYVPAQYDTMKITTVCEREIFTAKGRTLIKDGYRLVFGKDALSESDLDINKAISDDETDDPNAALPPVNVGENARNTGLKLESKKTRAPKHYTLASFSAAIEHIGEALIVDKAVLQNKQMLDFLRDKGIGTASTRGRIIDKLFEYGWVQKDKKYMLATRKAFETLRALPQTIKSPEMTAQWDYNLNEIAQHQFKSAINEALQFENEIYSQIQNVINTCIDGESREYINAQLQKLTPPPSVTFPCPQCGQPLRKLKGQYGIFWGCKACKLTFQDNKDKPLLQPMGAEAPLCPKCGSKLKLIKSKKGKLFWICTKEKDEKCDFIVDDKNGQPQMADRCPHCNSVLRRLKRKNGPGFFWVCTNDACTHKFYDDLQGTPVLEERTCKRCGAPMRLLTHTKDGKAVTPPYFYCTAWKENHCDYKEDKYGKEYKLPPRKKEGDKKK